MKHTTIIHNELDKVQMIERMKHAEIKEPVKVETSLYKAKRSDEQNRLMWFWYGEIQKFIREHMGQNHSTDDIHEFMVEKLLPKHSVEINGETKVIRSHTSKFKVSEMTNYLETLDHYCGSELGLSLPHPDMYKSAMGIK